MHVASYINSCPRCIRRKTQPDVAPLHNIEATQPLELIHLDYLQIEPSKGNIENVLIVADQLPTAKLLWNNFIVHYGFSTKIISDQGHNFESELIANLCQVAGVQKLRTSPYHPQMYGQCEWFNSTLLNMLDTLTHEQKKDWKTYVPPMVHAYNYTKNTATGYSPYYLLFGREPRLPIDVEFGLKSGNQQVPPSRFNYLPQLQRRLRFAHNKAKQVAGRQQARHKGLYDRRCKGAALDIGYLVLVKKTAWKGRHEIQDRWQSDEYQVIGQPNPGIPVYEVQNVARGRTRVLHQNLLLTLQGRVRQQGGQEVKDPQSPEEEKEEESGVPGVPKAPQVKTGKRHVSLQAKPIQHVEASSQDASADLKSGGSSDFRLLPESLLSEDSSEEDEVYTDSLTSHTTASGSTIGNLTSSLGPISSRVEKPNIVSKTESQFISSMPYLKDSTPLVDDNSTPLVVNLSDSHASGDDSVFVSDSSNDVSSPISFPVTPIPRRSTRSTRGKPPERYGKVYTFDTLVEMGSYFQMPM